MSCVGLNLQQGGQPFGGLRFRLYDDVCPKTCRNFRELCTGQNGFSYVGSPFHRNISNFMCQGGDFTKANGSGGKSIYGEKFADESFAIKHHKRGLLSMANSGPDTNGSQFFILYGPTPWLDNKHVVFGELLDGEDTLKRLENLATNDGSQSNPVTIVDCGTCN